MTMAFSADPGFRSYLFMRRLAAKCARNRVDLARSGREVPQPVDTIQTAAARGWSRPFLERIPEVANLPGGLLADHLADVFSQLDQQEPGIIDT
jgi:hypothetical protein